MTVIREGLIIAERDLRHWRRQPWTPVLNLAFTIVLLVMFAVILGGSIRLPGGGDEGAPPGRRRQVRAEDLQRVGGRDGRAKALFEESPQTGYSWVIHECFAKTNIAHHQNSLLEPVQRRL